MKKILLAIEILFTFLFFIFPPLISNQQQENISVKVVFSLNNLIAFCIAVFLFVFNNEIYKSNYKSKTISSPAGLIKNHGYSLIAFGTLILIAGFIQLCVYLFCEDMELIKHPAINWASSFFEFFGFLAAITSSVFVEEVIYRFIFVDLLKEVTGKKLNILWEFLSICLFAFAHKYLGFPAVINAFFCGIVLRVLFIRTKSIWNCYFVHLIYNLLNFILLFLLK